LSCGLTLGFGVFALFTMATLAAGSLGEPVARLLKAIGYSFGFVFVIMSRTELFTEHTTLAVIPVLSGHSSFAKLGRLWGLVYVGNQIGIALFAGFMVITGPALDVMNPQQFADTATLFVDLSTTAMLSGAVLAGWLMALLAWILTSVGDTISRILVIFVVTFLIGVVHFPPYHRRQRRGTGRYVHRRAGLAVRVGSIHRAHDDRQRSRRRRVRRAVELQSRRS
jgi:formate/nitrite transporter FocA (FNT family)